MVTKPEIARALGRDTYPSKMCPADGCKERYTETHECVACVSYRKAVEAGNINGYNGKANNTFIKRKQTGHEWCDEERQERAEAIKRGIKRKNEGI